FAPEARRLEHALEESPAGSAERETALAKLASLRDAMDETIRSTVADAERISALYVAAPSKGDARAAGLSRALEDSGIAWSDSDLDHASHALLLITPEDAERNAPELSELARKFEERGMPWSPVWIGSAEDRVKINRALEKEAPDLQLQNAYYLSG